MSDKQYYVNVGTDKKPKYIEAYNITENVEPKYNGWLVSNSFWKRMWAIYFYGILAGFIALVIMWAVIFAFGIMIGLLLI